jgi:hypothetical protein
MQDCHTPEDKAVHHECNSRFSMPMLILCCSHSSIVPLLNCVLVHTQEAEQVLNYRDNLPPGMQRSLQQAAGPAIAANFEGVTNVKTPVELQAAVSEGARHILITEHLDLTTLEPSKLSPNSNISTILEISNSTLSIHVRLSSSCCAGNIGGCAHLACMLPFAPLLWQKSNAPGEA